MTTTHLAFCFATALCACSSSGACFGEISSPPLLPAASASPSLAIFYSFENTPASDTLTQMQRELGRILSPSGITVAWRSIEENRGKENYPEVLVFRFRGACDLLPLMYSELGPESGIHELAETRRANGRMLPFGQVECDQLRRYLAPVAQMERPSARNGLIGRAMARVMAHEIYHMLTGSSEHGRQGIARASHSRQDLVSKTFDFARTESDWLRDWNRRIVLAADAPVIPEVGRDAEGESATGQLR